MAFVYRLGELEKKLLVQETMRSVKQETVDRLKLETEELAKEEDVLQGVEKALLRISTQVIARSTQRVDKLVTLGLRAVFHDQDLSFRVEVRRYRGKTGAKLTLRENGKLAPLDDSYGGGVLAVIGVLLRVALVDAFKLRRVLLLDETLTHLSIQYHERASALLRKLCSDLNFQVLMVTHASAFARYADRHYLAKKGSKGTEFELVGESEQ